MVKKRVHGIIYKILAAGCIAAVAATGMTGFLTGCVGSNKEGETGTIEGTWAGVLQYTYYCEGGAETVQLTIAGSTVTITGGTITEGDFPTYPLDTTGTIEQQDDQAYIVTLEVEGTLLGQMLFDPARNYALLLVRQNAVQLYGLVGILQKGELSSVTYDESDLVGDWAGVAVRINSDLEVTQSSESTATITQPDGLELNGTDGDGAFSAPDQGIVQYGAGVYVSGDDPVNPVSWDGEDYSALYALSYDKKILAVAFLKRPVDDNGLCNYNLFDELPDQKLALWIRQ